jgi:CubicO group peptidase (beta-lactamase class C family)
MSPNSFPRCTPEQAGVPSPAILNFIQAVEDQKLGLHSFMLVRHGQVASEGWWKPYAPEIPHILFSLTKSFTSTAVGLAISEGYLTLDDPVLSFFPEDTPAKISSNLAAMRVRHLLSMSTGHDKDATSSLFRYKGRPALGFLKKPVKHAPGTHFVYNSAASHMLSLIVQKLTGQTLKEYLTPRLFEPLGIFDPEWECDSTGANFGGWGLCLKTEEIALFGQLYLQEGLWKGQRLIPQEWVKQATSKQVSNGSDPKNDWNQGYGFQFWRCQHNAYRGDGAFGQYCLVFPDQDALLAITSGTPDMQAVLNAIYQHLLPGFQPHPLPEDPPALFQLNSILSSLVIPTPQGNPTSPLASRFSTKTYLFERNQPGMKKISFDFSTDPVTINVYNRYGKHTLAAGYLQWMDNTLNRVPPTYQKIAVSGAWTSQDTYQFDTCYLCGPFIESLRFHFFEDHLEGELTQNVSFRPTKTFPFKAHAKNLKQANSAK